MKKIILILALFLIGHVYSQSPIKTTKNDTITINQNFSTIYRMQIASTVLTGTSATLIYFGTKNKNDMLSICGGVVGIFAVLCEIIKLDQYRQLGEKTKRIKITGDKIIIKL